MYTKTDDVNIYILYLNKINKKIETIKDLNNN